MSSNETCKACGMTITWVPEFAMWASEDDRACGQVGLSMELADMHEPA